MKRALTLLIALSIFFSVGVTSFTQDDAAETEKILKYDVRAYNKALNLMNSLFGEAVFGETPNQALTRAEFVKGLTGIFGIPEVEGASIYSDVLNDHECVNAINAAYMLGWISKADKFNPDVQITLEQALKILLVAADYDILAEAKGGFPAGYISVANSINLLKNITVADGTLVSAADATIFFYNLMLAPVFEITSWGNKMNFETGKEVYLEKMYDAYAVKGIVTATEHSSVLLDAPFKKNNGKIAIDGIEYKYENSDLSLLGTSVTAYCSKEESQLKQVYCLIPAQNYEIFIPPGGFEKISNDYLYYYDDSRLCKEKLESAYKVIYNGRRVATLEDYMLKDIGAKIRLLSNNGNNEYEYIFIDSYTYGVITSIDYVNGYIAFETPSELVDLTNDKEHVSYIRDDKGNKMEIYELTKDMAAAIKTSADGRIYELIILSDTTAGLVTGICMEEGELTFGDKTYRVSRDFKQSYIDTSLISVGDRINVVIGIHGEIAYFISSSSGAQYGLLHDVERNTSGVEGSVYVKILTGLCKFEIFKLAKRIVADGVAVKLDYAYTYILEKCAESRTDSANPVLVIKYETNEDGLVTMIDFASNDTSNFDKVLDPQDSLTRYLKNATLKYRNSGFPSKVMLKRSTVVCVPRGTSDKDDESNYTIGNYSMLSSNMGDYTIDAYDVDETGNAAYVIVYLDDAETNKMAAYTDSYMVEKVSNALIDDEEGIKLQCWSNNKFETVFIPNSVNIDKTSGSTTLVPGDIVRFTMLNGKAKEVYVDYDYSSGVHISDKKGGASFETPNAQHYLSFVSGKVYSVGSDTIVISDALDNEGNTSFVFEDLRPYSINETIACFDSVTRKIRTIKLENIHTYKGYGQNADTVLLRSDYDNPKCAFIIR